MRFSHVFYCSNDKHGFNRNNAGACRATGSHTWSVTISCNLRYRCIAVFAHIECNLSDLQDNPASTTTRRRIRRPLQEFCVNSTAIDGSSHQAVKELNSSGSLFPDLSNAVRIESTADLTLRRSTRSRRVSNNGGSVTDCDVPSRSKPRVQRKSRLNDGAAVAVRQIDIPAENTPTASELIRSLCAAAADAAAEVETELLAATASSPVVPVQDGIQRVCVPSASASATPRAKQGDAATMTICPTDRSPARLCTGSVGASSLSADTRSNQCEIAVSEPILDQSAPDDPGQRLQDEYPYRVLSDPLTAGLTDSQHASPSTISTTLVPSASQLPEQLLSSISSQHACFVPPLFEDPGHEHRRINKQRTHVSSTHSSTLFSQFAVWVPEMDSVACVQAVPTRSTTQRCMPKHPAAGDSTAALPDGPADAMCVPAAMRIQPDCMAVLHVVPSSVYDTHGTALLYRWWLIGVVTCLLTLLACLHPSSVGHFVQALHGTWSELCANASSVLYALWSRVPCIDDVAWRSCVSQIQLICTRMLCILGDVWDRIWDSTASASAAGAL